MNRPGLAIAALCLGLLALGGACRAAAPGVEADEAVKHGPGIEAASLASAEAQVEASGCGAALSEGRVRISGVLQRTKGGQLMLEGALLELPGPEGATTPSKRSSNEHWYGKQVLLEAERCVHHCDPQAQCLSSGEIPFLVGVQLIEFADAPVGDNEPMDSDSPIGEPMNDDPDAAPTQTQPTAPVAAAATGNGVAEDYPKTRRLCDQRVYGDPGSSIHEIHWTLDASKDELSKVIAFYRAQSGHTEEADGDDVSFDFGLGLHIDVFHVSRRSSRPSCGEEQPKSSEKTLILRSQAR